MFSKFFLKFNFFHTKLISHKNWTISKTWLFFFQTYVKLRVYFSLSVPRGGGRKWTSWAPRTQRAGCSRWCRRVWWGPRTLATCPSPGPCRSHRKRTWPPPTRAAPRAWWPSPRGYRCRNLAPAWRWSSCCGSCYPTKTVRQGGIWTKTWIERAIRS